MGMGNIHALKVKWSKLEIDADKDMNGKSLTNLNYLNARIFTPESGFQITKSPAGNTFRIITPTGYMDVGSANISHAHFYTDRPSFYFDREVLVNGKVSPYNNDTYDLGEMYRRWLNAWFAGSVGLGVIKSPGSTLTVDVIYDDYYVEVASDHTLKIYDMDVDQIADDWQIGTLSTFTANGVVTGIKIQIKSAATTQDAIYRLYEDGVEIVSFYCGSSADFIIYSAETNSIKRAATYEGKVIKTTKAGIVSIVSRYLYFKKRYLGIKAG